jgi:hypothetical protein
MDQKRSFRPTFVRALVGTTVAAALAMIPGVNLVSTVVASAAPSSAEALLGQSQAAVRSQATVSIRIRSSNSHGMTATGSFSQGNGYLTEARTKAGSVQSISIVLIGTMVYLRGNESALTSAFQFPASAGKKYAGKWLSFTSKTATFKGFTSTFRVTAILSSILKTTHPVSVGATTTFDGKKAIPLKGSTKTTTAPTKYIPAVLYLSTSGTHLPIGAIQKTRGVTSGTATFSFSSKPKTFPVPAHPTPLITLIKSGSF